MRQILDFGHCTLDLNHGRAIWQDGRVESFTATELKLLVHLASKASQPASRQELLTEVWGYSPKVRSHTLANSVFRIRRKLEVDPKSPEVLVSRYGVGYSLSAPAADPLGFVAHLLGMPHDLDDDDHADHLSFIAEHGQAAQEWARTASDREAVAVLVRLLRAGPIEGLSLDLTWIQQRLEHCEGATKASLLAAWTHRTIRSVGIPQAVALSDKLASVLDEQVVDHGHLEFCFARVLVLIRVRKLEEAESLARWGIAHAGTLENRRLLATLQERLAHILAQTGRVDLADHLFRDAADTFRAIQAPLGLLRTRHNWANIRWLHYADASAALTMYDQTAAALHEVGDPMTAGKALLNKVNILLHCQRFAAAKELAAAETERAIQAADQVHRERATVMLARAHLGLGELEQAKRELHWLNYLIGDNGLVSRRAGLMRLLGWVALMEGEPLLARGYLRQAGRRKNLGVSRPALLWWTGLTYPENHATRRRLIRMAKQDLEEPWDTDVPVPLVPWAFDIVLTRRLLRPPCR